jgi:hypothetical protein
MAAPAGGDQRGLRATLARLLDLEESRPHASLPEFAAARSHGRAVAGARDLGATDAAGVAVPVPAIASGAASAAGLGLGLPPQHERRTGSAAAHGDLLDVGVFAVDVGAAPVVVPADRLATRVLFPGYASKSISKDAKRQREEHKATLILQGIYTGAED